MGHLIYFLSTNEVMLINPSAIVLGCFKSVCTYLLKFVNFVSSNIFLFKNHHFWVEQKKSRSMPTTNAALKFPYRFEISQFCNCAPSCIHRFCYSGKNCFQKVVKPQGREDALREHFWQGSNFTRQVGARVLGSLFFQRRTWHPLQKSRFVHLCTR